MLQFLCHPAGDVLHTVHTLARSTASCVIGVNYLLRLFRIAIQIKKGDGIILWGRFAPGRTSGIFLKGRHYE